MLRREFHELPDGYVLSLPEASTELRVERLRRDRDGLVGELTVESALPGTKSHDGHLHAADFNLSSARVRQERAKQIAERANAPEIDWIAVLEDLCRNVLAAERRGQPAVLLREVPRPEPDEDMTVDAGVRLLKRHPVILFGDGGDAKSYLALYWATRLAGAGLRVLYADWEFSAEDHRERLQRIAGDDMPPILYVRCERPMTAEVDRLRRIVADEHVDYVICDSIAFACDGPPEAAEVAGAYFRALRQLTRQDDGGRTVTVGSLHIAHRSKAEGGEDKPFGSAFWHNGARATWFAKRSAGSADDGLLKVGLFNRKSNVGPVARPVGYAITFSETRTRFDRVELADVPDLAGRLPLWQRMLALLKTEGAMTIAEIASELDEKVDTVSKTVRRSEGRVFVKVPGPDNVYRIGLVMRDAA